MAGQKKVQIKISAEAQEVINTLNATGKKLVQFGTNAQRLGQNLGTVFDPLMKTLTGIAAGLTAASAAVAGASLSIGGSFEDSMLKVKGVSGATQEEFEALSAKAREIGADLPVTAQQAADAMYNMASAGMSVGEILDGVNGIVALSVSQGYDLASTADVVMATLSSFNLEASETGRIADVFSNAISNSQLNMEKLAYAMRYAAPVANTLGVSLEETVAAMQALAEAGLKGEQIGTYLRGIMTAIVDPAPKALQVYESLGVAVRDAEGKVRNFADVLRDLKAAGAGAEELVMIFGRELSAAGAILVSAADDLAGFEQELRKVGTTQKLLEEQMTGFRNMVKELKSAIQENLLIVFDGIKDKAKEAVGHFRDLTRAFGEWSKETEAVGMTIEAFFEGLGLQIMTVGDFRKALDKIDLVTLQRRFQNLGEGVKALYESLKNIASAIPWKTLAENLDTITGIIVTGWAAGKIALIAGGVANLGRAFGVLAKGVKAAAASRAGVGLLSMIGLSAPQLGLVLAFTGATVALVSALKNANEEIDTTGLNMKRVENAINGNMVAFDLLPKHVQEVVRAIQREEEAFKKIEDISEKAVAATEKRLKTIGALPEEMAKVIKSVSESYADESQAVSRVLRQFGDDIRTYLSEAGNEGAANLVTAFGQMGDKVGNIMMKVIEDIQGLKKEAAKPVPTYTGNVVEAMRQAVTEFTVYAADLVNKTKDLKNRFGLSGEEAGAALEESLTAKLREISDKLVNEFDNPALRTIFKNTFVEMAEQAGGGFYRNLRKYLDDALGLTETTVKSLDEQLQEALSKKQIELGGEWKENAVISEDENRRIVQVTDGIRYMSVELQKAKEQSGQIGFDELVRSLGNLKTKISEAFSPENIDTSKITADVSSALNALSAPAQATGKTIGNGLYDGIMQGVNRAVKEAKAALANIKAPGVPAAAGGSVTDTMRSEL
jgi:TP901 family phage tail tape measure protein